MMDLFPRQLKTMVKGGLRDVRHIARKVGKAAQARGETPASFGTPNPALLIGKIAGYSDATLTALEAIARDIVAGKPEVPHGFSSPQPLTRYFGESIVDGATRLASDCRAAAREILRAKGVQTIRLDASSPDGACELARKNMPAPLRARLAAGGALSVDDVCLASACLSQGIAQTLIVQEPLILRDERRDGDQEAVLFVAAAFALASAVATCSSDPGELDGIHDAVCSAIDSRYAAIRLELAPGASPEPLAKLFQGLIRHLP